jgi:hypothetical protein
MSRIYEALRNAQTARSKSELPAADSLGVMDMPERRASPRVELDLQITVYGYVGGQSPFYEQATAVRGNVAGGTFLLAAPVLEGQDLLLINNKSSLEQTCRVVNVRILDAQTSEVSVAFDSPTTEFWQLPGIL